MVLPLHTWVILRKLFTLSEVQFLYLQDGVNTHFTVIK